MFNPSNITSVVFDWGRTLWNPEAEDLFNGARQVLEKLSVGRRLMIVSLATKGSEEIERRKRIIADLGIEELFAYIVFVSEEKDEAYASLFAEYKLDPLKTVIVDDRIIRGIAWGNRIGVHTIWFQNGKFKDELPSKETGDPTFTITDFGQLETIFTQNPA